jgi:hypothetical protein
MAVPKNPERKPEVEFEPDAWQRFERAVDAAIKSGPKHRVAKKKTVTAKRQKVAKKKTRS